MSGVAVFEPYEVRPTSIAATCRGIDDAVDQITALTRENGKLRREAANALACSETERAESARLRGENQRLANQLAEARAIGTAGRMSP